MLGCHGHVALSKMLLPNTSKFVALKDIDTKEENFVDFLAKYNNIS